MTVFEFAVTYAVCWWLVLFMILPYKAEASVQPQTGHAPSAPANPRLRQKCKLTTLLALVPTLALYLIISDAKAGDSIYHVGSGNDCTNYVPSDDIVAKDGYATGGKKVKPANLEEKNPYVAEEYSMPLRIPGEKYIKTPPSGSTKTDLSDSFISAGDVKVSKDGTTTLNGTSITSQQYPDCGQAAKKQ